MTMTSDEIMMRIMAIATVVIESVMKMLSGDGDQDVLAVDEDGDGVDDDVPSG